MIDVVLPLPNVKGIYSLAEGGVTNTEMRLYPAGTANVAFYIAKLGGNSAFIGRVGDDYLGKIFLEDLEKNGILASISITKEGNTGVVFVLVFPDGERFFIVNRGANARFKYEDFALDLIRDSKYFFFSGYSFQDKEFLDSIKRLLGEIANDTCVVFNPGAPNLVKEFRDSFISIIHQYVSILILNEAEAKYLTGCVSEREMLDSLLSMADIIAVTKGGKGSIIARQNEIYEIKAKQVKVVDTTGAGDAYAAGFIYGLSQGYEVKAAGEFASRVATSAIGHFGARVNLSNLTFQ